MMPLFSENNPPMAQRMSGVATRKVAADIRKTIELQSFMETVAPIAQGNPEMAELVAQVGLFAVRGFRVARTLEDAFEKAFNALGKMPPPPPKGASQAAIGRGRGKQK